MAPYISIPARWTDLLPRCSISPSFTSVSSCTEYLAVHSRFRYPNVVSRCCPPKRLVLVFTSRLFCCIDHKRTKTYGKSRKPHTSRISRSVVSYLCLCGPLSHAQPSSFSRYEAPLLLTTFCPLYPCSMLHPRDPAYLYMSSIGDCIMLPSTVLSIDPRCERRDPEAVAAVSRYPEERSNGRPKLLECRCTHAQVTYGNASNTQSIAQLPRYGVV
ncbi:hypothetical protein BD311DRAFT_513931 [Dichomitus squalens]|uniref:Uncharacterized protein n=1 Tax=Dichomitus squalens TaxID=114155 RepID=A0A4Q9MZA3_9APHY|nr:hypothetical protein BD311DRAFT_513931 [Dichomitus squalens]